MPKTIKTKQNMTITLDKDLVKIIKRSNLNVSRACNNFLHSLFTNPQSLNPHNLEVPCSSHGTGIYIGFREVGFENSDLKSTCVLNKQPFTEWVNSSYSKQYSKDVLSNINKMFSNCKTLKDIKTYVNETNVNQRSIVLALRVFLNYCEQYDKLPLEYLNFARQKIKLPTNNGIDAKVPNNKQMHLSLSTIKENYPQFLIYYKLILESGCRITELKNMILTFDKKNIEEYDNNIILYRNFSKKGNKSNYYLFFRKETFELLDTKISDKQFECFKERMRRHKDIISCKYLRKFMYTKCLEVGITLHIADYYQGRDSKSVGLNHYTNLKLQAIKEYKKLLPALKEY